MSTVDAKTTAETSVATRVITIVSTRGEKVKIAFSGSEFTDLKRLLESGGTDINGKAFSRYDLSNMKCVEGVNKTTLEHPKAVVPDGDFNLFLMPYKSKSGAFNRVDCYTKIKKFINKDGDKATAHFNAGKNYTNKSTDDLNALIESYNPGYTRENRKRKAEAIVDVAESFLEAGSADEAVAQLQGLSVEQKLDIIAKILYTNANSKATVNVIATPVKSQEEIEREEKEAREKLEKEEAERKQKEEEEQENKQLQSELSELMGGFTDVRR